MNDDAKAVARQQQFLDVISRDEATERFEAALSAAPVGIETVALAEALNRVLADDIPSPVDVTTFDRSNVDGFAVRSTDTVSATEEEPRQLRLNDEIIAPGKSPRVSNLKLKRFGRSSRMPPRRRRVGADDGRRRRRRSTRKKDPETRPCFTEIPR